MASRWWATASTPTAATPSTALLGERFIPRLNQAKPDSLLDAEGLLDPAKCWAAMMANEKPGGHGERSVAVGVLDMALLGCRRQGQARAAVEAAGRPLQRRPGRREGVGLCRRRLLLSRQGPRRAAGRDEALSRPRLFLREDEGGRRAARRGPEAHRGGAEDSSAPATGWRSTSTASSTYRRRSSSAAPSRTSACAGTKSRSIPSTIWRMLPSRRSTRRHSQPARISSRCRMRGT